MDEDELRTKLEKEGLPEDAIRAYLREEWSKQGIDVLECNWNAVAAFQRCQLEWVGGFDRPRCVGVRGDEIERACRLLNVEYNLEIVDSIKYLTSEYASALLEA